MVVWVEPSVLSVGVVLEGPPDCSLGLQPEAAREGGDAEPAIQMVLEAAVVDWAYLKVN